MALDDDVIHEINKILTDAEYPMKAIEFDCWRPVTANYSYEHYEPIHEIDRLFACHPVYTMLFIESDGRRYEYRIYYNNRSGELDLDEVQLTTCNYTPEEDPKKIEEAMKNTMMLIAASVIPGALRKIYIKKKKDSGL